MSNPLDIAIGGSIPLHNGLRHYWSFDDVTPANGTDDWLDIVHALGPASVMFTGGGTPSKVAGLNGNAVRLESSASEYLKETNAVFTKGVNPLGSGDFTIAGWWKIRSVPNIQDLFARWDSTAGEGEFLLQYRDPSAGSNPDVIKFLGSSDGSAQDLNLFSLSTSGQIPLNEWLFIAITRDGTDVSIQVNQSGVDTTTVSNTYSFNPSTREAIIGAIESAGAPVRYADIDIDSLGFWNRGLSITELDSLYNSGSGNIYPFNTAPLLSLASGIISCHRLGGTAGAREFDVIVETRNDFTANNSPTPVVGAVGSGTEFDGINQWFELDNTPAAPEWQIGTKDWTMGLRFVNLGVGTNYVLIAKNDETGVGGNGTEWQVQYLERSGVVPPRLAWRVLQDGAPQDGDVQASGTLVGGDLDDGNFHSVLVGHINNTGTWIQIDNGTRVLDGRVASGTNAGNADVTIGRRDFAPAPLYAEAIIDSVHLWNRELTETERTIFLTGASPLSEWPFGQQGGAPGPEDYTDLATIGNPHIHISGLPAFSDPIIWPFGSSRQLTGNVGFSVDVDALLTGLNAQFGFNQQPHRFTMNWANRSFDDDTVPDIIGDLVDFDINEFRIRGRVTHVDVTKSDKGRFIATSIEDQRKDLNEAMIDTYGLFDIKDNIVSLPIIDVHHFHLQGGLAKNPKALRLLREHGATYQQIFEAVGDLGNLQDSIPSPSFVAARLGQAKAASYRWAFRTTPLLDAIVKIFTDISYDLYWDMSNAKLRVIDRTERITIDADNIPGVQIDENTSTVKEGKDEGERPTSVLVLGGRMEGVIGQGGGGISFTGGVSPANSSVALNIIDNYTFLPAWENASVFYFGADGTIKEDKPSDIELSAALKGIEWWAQKKSNVTSKDEAIASRIDDSFIHPRDGAVYKNLSGHSASGVGLIPNRGNTDDAWVVEWYNRVRNFAQNHYTRSYYLNASSDLFQELERFEVLDEAWCGLENENGGAAFNPGYQISSRYRWIAAFWNEDANKLSAWMFISGRPLWGIDGKGVPAQHVNWNEDGVAGVYIPIEVRQWNRASSRLTNDASILPIEKSPRGLLIRLPNICWQSFITDEDVVKLKIPQYLAGKFRAETTTDNTIDPLKRGTPFAFFNSGVNIPIQVFERYGFQKPVQFSAQGGAVGFRRGEIQQRDDLVPWSFEPRGTKNTVELLQEEGEGIAQGRVVNRADVDFLEITTVGLPGISFDNYADIDGSAQHGITNLSVSKNATSFWQTRYSAKTHFPQPIKVKPIQEETMEDFRFALHRVNEKFNRPPKPVPFSAPGIFDPQTEDGSNFLQFPKREQLELLVTITDLVTVTFDDGSQDIAYGGEDENGLLWPAALRANLLGILNPNSKLAQFRNAFATDGFFQKGMQATYHYEELENGDVVHYFTGGIALSNARVVEALGSPALVGQFYRMDVQMPQDTFIRTIPNSDPPQTETVQLEQILIKNVAFTDNQNVDTTISIGDKLLTSGFGNENGNMLKPTFNQAAQQYEIDVGPNAPENQRDKIFILTGGRGGAAVQFAVVTVKPDPTTGRGGKIQTISTLSGGTLFEDQKIIGAGQGNAGTQYFVDFIGAEFNSVSLGDPAIIIQEVEPPPSDPEEAATTPSRIRLLTYIVKPSFTATDAFGTST